MRWIECIESGNARKVSKDPLRSQSLKQIAYERIAQINTPSEVNCNFVFEDYYTSLLEIIQAITFKEGYNITNHLCLTSYLKEIMKRHDLSDIFDDLRIKRNALTYYGTKMDFETAQQALFNCQKIIKALEVIS